MNISYLEKNVNSKVSHMAMDNFAYVENIVAMKNRISEWRKKRDLTVEDLAEKVNTSPGQISRLQNGSRRLDTEWLEKISLALHCSPIDLIRLDDADEDSTSVPLKEDLYTQILAKFFDVLRETPALIKEWESEDLAKVLLAMYHAEHEEEEELDRKATISKTSIKERLKLYYGGLSRR